MVQKIIPHRADVQLTASLFIQCFLNYKQNEKNVKHIINANNAFGRRAGATELIYSSAESAAGISPTPFKTRRGR